VSADCIFCRIVRGEAPCHRVDEDALTLTFMDAFPVTDGHTLVITKAHDADIFATTETALAAVAAASHRVAAAIRATLAPDGLMVFQLNGAAAMQTVFHYHMHLLPRRAGEPLALHSRVPGDPVRLAELARLIGGAIAKR
jgi:histidine triad (HIT) family protein